MKKDETQAKQEPRFPGIPHAMDGTGAVVAVETAGGEAAGAYPITPSTNMGEGWAQAVAQGKKNVFGRRLIFFEPEGEHAAAGVSAGMSVVGLRTANFSSAQGIAYMHESLYAAVGKRLTYVLNMACRAITKQSLNIHCGHDDYHCVDDTGFFQLFAKNVQEAADMNLIAHRIAELSLNPGVCAQDGFLTSHVIETLRLPEPDLVREYLGDPADIIECPTPAQRLMFGEKRRRIPELFDLDNPAMLGTVQNQDSYAQGVAAQRPFFFDHIQKLADQAFAEFEALTGRQYGRAMGYRLEDADYVIVGQGSFVPNAEAACDYLRDKKKIKVGVLNMTMFRPFPSDLVSMMLKGKKGVVVLERTDQPLASDAPLLREIRTTMVKAMENGRALNGVLPYPTLAACKPEEVPEFYSGCYGLGSRDVQPADLLASVFNMLPDGPQRRQFYLGIDFIRESNQQTELGVWMNRVVEAYPEVKELALQGADPVNLLPDDAVALRIHSIGGWGAITMGKSITMTLFNLLGLHVKSNPKYGSEKKGQPTTFYATFSHEPIRLNCDLKFVNVVLSPDPNVFQHSNPLEGLGKGGVFIIQTDQDPDAFWESLPAWARQNIKDMDLKVFLIDAFGVAKAETEVPELQLRMQGNVFMGAFFRASPLMKRENMDEKDLFVAIEKQLQKAFGHKGQRVVEDNARVIRRGFDEVQELDWKRLREPARKEESGQDLLPWYLQPQATDGQLGDASRFYGQVCSVYRHGEEPIADPFAAVSAIPGATGVFRDMTGIRFEVPKFDPAKCTGCGQCWTQCPDSAIPGLVTEIEDLLVTAARAVDLNLEGALMSKVGDFSGVIRETLKNSEFKNFTETIRAAYGTFKSELPAEQRQGMDDDFSKLVKRLDRFPLTRTAPFFTSPEAREPGSGGLLSVTINPYACKGCMLCVDVCPDQALSIIKQDTAVVDELKHQWDFWKRLPDTPERYIQVSDREQGIGVLHTLLLKKEIYETMVGGDGSCMGCGEKTATHLILAAVEGALQPRVVRFVAKLEDLIQQLDRKARILLASGADLDQVMTGDKAQVDLTLSDESRQHLSRINKLLNQLKDLRWRYTTGPTGLGRASLGMTNATGCSSVWASTYPFNPYPFPWTNHLFQDAPSIAIGIFEGHMRKMADGFAAVRKAEMELGDAYDPAVHDDFFAGFDYRQFSDEEFQLCPPIFATGGDGAMFDIGFQNLSRLLASGKPLRVIVLDTQVYSNTGGQACTSGYYGQISDMAAFGGAQHGKEEQRKEMSLIAMAHRDCFLVQSSQAAPAHLLGGAMRGLTSRHPALFNIYSPCQTEHGIADNASFEAAKLALESRAFPLIIFDPDAGMDWSERIELDGNPALEEDWPSYDLAYVAEDGSEQTINLPMTIADWAATQGRFVKHFRKIKDPGAAGFLPVAEFIKLSPENREGIRPFIYVINKKRQLDRFEVSDELIVLAEERLRHWRELRLLAGIQVSESVRDEVAAELEEGFEQRLEAVRQEYEQKIAQLKASYPHLVARRLAETLLASPDEVMPLAGSLPSPATPSPAAAPAPAVSAPAPAAQPKAETRTEDDDDEELTEGPWIQSELCTTCDECTNINPKMFAYNDQKKAYIKDPKAGTFKDLVMAAERCSARAIHPGTPLNPNEKDLKKWLKRAEPFQ